MVLTVRRLLQPYVGERQEDSLVRQSQEFIRAGDVPAASSAEQEHVPGRRDGTQSVRGPSPVERAVARTAQGLPLLSHVHELVAGGERAGVRRRVGVVLQHHGGRRREIALGGDPVNRKHDLLSYGNKNVFRIAVIT